MAEQFATGDPIDVVLMMDDAIVEVDAVGGEGDVEVAAIAEDKDALEIVEIAPPEVIRERGGTLIAGAVFADNDAVGGDGPGLSVGAVGAYDLATNLGLEKGVETMGEGVE